MAMQAFSSATGGSGPRGYYSGPGCFTKERLIVVDDEKAGRAGDAGFALRVDQQDFRAGVLEDPLEFGGGEAGIQHHEDGADPHGGEVGLERHGAVGSEDGDAISGHDSQIAGGRPPDVRRGQRIRRR